MSRRLDELADRALGTSLDVLAQLSADEFNDLELLNELDKRIRWSERGVWERQTGYSLVVDALTRSMGRPPLARPLYS